MMVRVGHKYNVQQSTAGMEHRSVRFVGNGWGRYPNKWMEQRPEGSEGQALRISGRSDPEGAVRARALWWVGVGPGVEEEEGSNVARGGRWEELTSMGVGRSSF